MIGNLDDAHQADEADEAAYAFDPGREAAGDGASDCAACGGTGKVALLVTTRRCEECGGSGKIAQGTPGGPFDEWGEPVPGRWVIEYAYDQQGRVASQRQWFVPDKVKPKGPGQGDVEKARPEGE